MWSLVLLAGCASQSDRQDAAGVAGRFLDAAQGGDAGTACALLTPQTRDELVASEGEECARALPVDRLGGGVRSADTWSDWAQVSTDHGTLFLTKFDSGWLVSAAGCAPAGDLPYRCVVGA